MYPAVDVRSGSTDVMLALVDDFGPTAIEERADSTRVFFSNTAVREAARSALAGARYAVEPIDVDDEDWARRSQENLGPITVGRITVAPPWWQPPAERVEPPAERVAQVLRPAPPAGQAGGVAQVFRPAWQAGLKSRATAAGGSTSHPAPGTRHPALGTIVISPSMGFGTGHHATTRLCLRALQALDLSDRFVLDVGTGSGVLAIAAVRLGAARAVGIDEDADAIASANENLALNSGVETVNFQVADLSSSPLPSADVVTANLAGALLVRSARLLLDLLRPGGTLIVSGLLEGEREGVLRAFAPARVAWEQDEEGWSAIALRKQHEADSMELSQSPSGLIQVGVCSRRRPVTGTPRLKRH